MQVRLVTKSDCELAVSIYPMFKYNAVGGGGSGTVQPLGGDMYSLKFDASTLVIPALNYKTASILGLPIPPPLNIAIVPSKLEVRWPCVCIQVPHTPPLMSKHSF
jgi:hypothetical protein